VRAAASIAVASISRGFDFRLLTTDGVELNHMMPASSIMDRLAEVGLSFRGSFESVFEQLMADLGGVSLTLLTGTVPQSELASLNRFHRRFEVITIAQFGEQGTERDRGVPNAILLSASTSEDFARAWNQTSRR